MYTVYTKCSPTADVRAKHSHTTPYKEFLLYEHETCTLRFLRQKTTCEGMGMQVYPFSS